jgi:long-subunit acyl-CoA synthetase (AMP-forming)
MGTELMEISHTSGTVGLPKLITWTHAFAASYIRQASLDPPPGYESQDRMFQKKRIFITFPPYNVRLYAQCDVPD